MQSQDFTVEKVIYDFLDTDYIRLPETQLYRFDINGKRYYRNENKIYPSVTHILHEVMPMNYGLLSWYVNNGFEKINEILEEKADYGTEMHKLFNEIILGAEFSLSEFNENQKQDTVGFIQWLQDHKIKPLAIEYVVHDEEKGYAGAVDLVCKMEYKNEEIIAMIDYKTGRKAFYDDHILQLEAYRQAWDKLNPDVKIDKIFNYGCKDYRLPIGKTVTPYRFKDHTDKEILENWELYLQIYQNNHKDVNTKQTVFDEEMLISSETDIKKCFKEIDYMELEEEKNE